jgi:hypothetical protein
MSGEAHESPRPVQEDDALPTRRVALVLVGFVGATLAGILYAAVLWGNSEHAIHERMRGRIAARAPDEAGPIPPDRHLMRDRRRFVDEWRAPQVEKLGQWGWVDQSRRIVHLPIEKAMDLVVKEGGR